MKVGRVDVLAAGLLPVLIGGGCCGAVMLDTQHSGLADCCSSGVPPRSTTFHTVVVKGLQ